MSLVQQLLATTSNNNIDATTIDTTNNNGSNAATSDIIFEKDNDTNSAGDDDDDEEAGSTVGTGIWTKEEHARFLEAIKIYANGPWKLVAAYVATRTVRQTMTHAQKYRQKAARRLRGLRTKQALMRMHYGHRISEESLIQERLRALTAQVESGSTAPSPLYTPSVAASSTLSTARCSTEASTRKRQRAGAKLLATASPAAPAAGSLLALLTDTVSTPPSTKRRRKSVAVSVDVANATAAATTTSMSEAFGAASPCTVDGINASVSLFDLVTDVGADLEIIDDLSEAPSLEECAEMLYDLLCC